MQATTYNFDERFDLTSESFDRIRYGFNIFALLLRQAAGFDDQLAAVDAPTYAVQLPVGESPINYFSNYAEQVIAQGRARSRPASWVSAD